MSGSRLGCTRPATFRFTPTVTTGGAGTYATSVKVPNSANTAVFVTENFASLAGTDADAGPSGWSMRDMTIDGNDTNNPTNSTNLACIQIYGQNYTLERLRVISGRGMGIYSDGTSTTNASPLVGGVASHCNEVIVINTQQMGIKFNGPHDTVWHAVDAFNCAKTSGDCLYDTKGVKAFGCHGWGVAHATTWVMRGGTHLNGCEAEGASTTQVLILGNDQTITSGQVYGGTTVGGLAFGITFGDASTFPSGIRVSTKILGCGTSASGGSLRFVHDAGGNDIDVLAYQPSGTLITGTPDATNVIKVSGNIAGGMLRPPGHQLTAVSYNPGTAASYTTTLTTFADVDATNLAVTFIVPAAGKVRITVSALLWNSTQGQTVKLNLRDSSGDLANTGQSMTADSISGRFTYTQTVSGLTPGTSKTYKLGWRVTGGTGNLSAGGATDAGPCRIEVMSI
ncbi:MAG: hypothetical protein JWM76_393 [Pseudonocardiales bacterium]|nr:hypothetical protein [Pseudonocardiales bacterium]